MVVGATSGLGPARIRQLLTHMDVAELSQRLQGDLASLPLSSAQLSRLAYDPAKVELALAWRERQANHHILCCSDPLYPPLLKLISDPPPVVFVKGRAETCLYPAIAMVGSRHASATGLQTASWLAAELSRLGFVISSGMAAGIDGAAHCGALDVQGLSLAVLGTGVDCIYPKGHGRLYHALVDKGCVMSEYWPDTQAFAGNFPRRNRIISGISLGTLVVEAARKSGSLITARMALEQGREVFAVPGHILDEQHLGCHDLLQSGAKLVTCAADIVEELSTLLLCQLEKLPPSPQIRAERSSQLPFASLLASVDYETTSLDRLVEHSGKPIDIVLEQLLELELQGWVAQVPGGYVRLKRN
ncbi:DNA-processing protein DprA [Shewanella cyperi]